MEAPAHLPPIPRLRGSGRQAAFDAIEARLAADAEVTIRALVAEQGLDLEAATDSYRGALEVVINRAVDVGRARLVPARSGPHGPRGGDVMAAPGMAWGEPSPVHAKRAEKRRRQRASGFVQRRRPGTRMWAHSHGQMDRDAPRGRRP